MRKTLLSSALCLCLFSSVSLAPVFVPATAYAQSGVAAVTTYYSDATHKTVVGMRTVYCDGHVTQTGTVTSFYTVRIVECAPQ